MNTIIITGPTTSFGFLQNFDSTLEKMLQMLK